MKNKLSAGILIFLLVALGGIGVILIALNINEVLGIIILVLTSILTLFIITYYNKLIRFRNKVKESLALVDIQLKLRFDLIPNLVDTVKGYAKHEKELFIRVTETRAKAANATSEEEKLNEANKLVPQMKNLIAVAEDYPELKADKLFKELMEQLVDIEDRLVSARRIYGSNVNIYNTSLQVFPQNIIAKIFGFSSQPFFQIETGESIVHKISME